MAGKSKKKKAAKKPRAKSQEPKAKKPKAKSQKPKAKSQEPKAKSQKPKAKLVWHIFHFRERFELPPAMRACRDGPLQFLKLPVAGDPYDNESHIFGEQWRMLEREEDTLVLEAVFIRLWKHGGRRSRKYRGYILNEHYAPATTRQISRFVKLDISQTAKALKVFKKYNLIERVAMPDFAAVADEPDEEDEPRKGAKSQRQKPKAKGQKPTETDADEGADGGRKPAAPPDSITDGRLNDLCDSTGMAFAEEVFAMLFGRKADTRRKGDCRELGAFAGCWNRVVLAKLKPLQLNELWEKSINPKPADKRRLMKARNPCAAWTSVFNGRLVGMQNKNN